MLRIAIDAGHGGKNSTPGKRSPDGEYEWNFNNKVLLSFISEIEKYENVQLLRLDDSTGITDVSLKKRTDDANSWNADLVISFHHNANNGSWGNWTGTETYVHLNASSTNRNLAKEVQKGLLQAYSLQDRGVKSANFHILRETNALSILIEGGFMDSFIDIKKLRDDSVLKKAGQKVAQIVAHQKQLKKKNDTDASKKSINSYKVLPGDTLWSISQKHQISVKQIMDWNNLSSHFIYVGDILIVSKK
ncbi:N-acetylmuramoyl-L-alanine amidase [Exiguobacterium undae]|uniref:LysM domain-containing protein n=1 Tax=Exiguobacterium undae TaxID=169177 RepID=A0ABX2V4V7_9BACL|nr:N-acetylmuramoyl-L-alanine amidase [Exiguobacterium undae]OAN10098.1 hypothetical protein A3783_15120 [Exiguobacterium undae]